MAFLASLLPVTSSRKAISKTRSSMCYLGLLGLVTLLVIVILVHKDQLTNEETLENPEFVVVLCGDKSSIDNLLRQVSVLLKSAATLTSRTLKFNIVTDSFTTYQAVTNITQSWPNVYRARIIFGDYTQVFYPPGTEKMRGIFRPCATARLFLAEVYKEKDNLVYLDRDTLFLVPPENLWPFIYKINDQQVIGAAPELYNYGPSFTTIPFYGTYGLNSGVLLMNLKRIRSFGENWTNAILETVEKYGKKLRFGDQDILNIIFSSKTRAMQVYEFGCEWNYHPWMCRSGTNKCIHAESVGIHLLHGTGDTFLTSREQKFQAVFRVWEEHQFEESVDVLAKRMAATLEHQKPSEGCFHTSTINQLLLRGLQGTLEWKKKSKG